MRNLYNYIQQQQPFYSPCALQPTWGNTRNNPTLSALSLF